MKRILIAAAIAATLASAGVLAPVSYNISEPTRRTPI
jgi:hypothetical protein